MAFAISNWNLDPNREWFVRLNWADPVVSVELYLTQADAQNQTGRQASGSAAPGGDVAVILTADPGGPEISFFQETEAWHLKISGQAGDPTAILRVRAFVDLDDITHPIYRNPLLITRRAAAGIDAHTHVELLRTLELAAHYPDAEPGQVVGLSSARRGLDVLCQVRDFTITGDPDHLVTTINCAAYTALTR